MWARPKSQIDLVKSLQATGALKDKRVAEVLQAVDRAKYCDDSDDAYLDGPLPIGHGATISAPHMHAYALDWLRYQLVPGCRALDVGSGSGYLTVCMALMMGPSGRAVGLEHMPELYEQGLSNVRADRPYLLDTGGLKLIEGDGRLGYPDEGPYDAIHVGAAAETIPEPLIAQLKPGGRLVIPVGDPDHYQVMTIVDKLPDGSISEFTDASVRYVPLCDKPD